MPLISSVSKKVVCTLNPCSKFLTFPEKSRALQNVIEYQTFRTEKQLKIHLSSQFDSAHFFPRTHRGQFIFSSLGNKPSSAPWTLTRIELFEPYGAECKIDNSLTTLLLRYYMTAMSTIALSLKLSKEQFFLDYILLSFVNLIWIWLWWWCRYILRQRVMMMQRNKFFRQKAA